MNTPFKTNNFISIIIILYSNTELKNFTQHLTFTFVNCFNFLCNTPSKNISLKKAARGGRNKQGAMLIKIQGYSKWLSAFVIHNTLEIAVCSCTDGLKNSQSFIWWAVCSSYVFLRLEHSLLRWRRTAVTRCFVCLHFMNIGQLRLFSGNSSHMEHL
jgi:hypothetical protein